MRNLLEEFSVRRRRILGLREHVFTGSVSSLASFMSAQETVFVTMGQRVLCNPLKVTLGCRSDRTGGMAPVASRHLGH